MRAMDVTTTAVITVDPDMSVQAVASSFPNGASAGFRSSMPPIGWWASSVATTMGGAAGQALPVIRIGLEPSLLPGIFAFEMKRTVP
jgi:hypothetical protein